MSAVLSACGLYRYRLERIVGTGPTLLWIMLNPSTADGTTDDPTIRRVKDFTERHEYGRAVVVNLYALRSPNPEHVRERLDVAEGPENFGHIMAAAEDARAVVCAWGSHPWAVGRAYEVCGWLDALDHTPEILCLGTTKGGAPRHPLYLPKSTYLTRFDWWQKERSR